MKSIMISIVCFLLVSTTAASWQYIKVDRFNLTRNLEGNDALAWARRCREFGDKCAGYDAFDDGKSITCDRANVSMDVPRESACWPMFTDLCGNTYDNVCHLSTAKSDCQSWLEAGWRRSGIYPIQPPGGASVCAFCDMTTDGGGWTLIQRRVSNCTDFYRGQADYIKGFGDLLNNHWLGLDTIAALTSIPSQLRVNLVLADGTTKYALFSSFSVEPHPGYILSVSGYSGTAGDSLTDSFHLHTHSGMEFSTHDHDVDNNPAGSCAQERHAAWWFNYCGYSSLNGPYVPPGTAGWDRTILWYKATGYSPVSLKESYMMVRRNV